MSSVNAAAHIIAAQIASQDSKFDQVADGIARIARAEAVAVAGSDFANSIEVQKVRTPRGIVDRLIVATDPLAIPKEFGHVIRNRAGGPDLGWVQGLRPMTRALAKIPEVSGD